MSKVEKPASVPTQIKPLTRYVAELIGTMVLVLMGCGSAVIASYNVGYLGVSFAFGLAVLTMVYAFGGISGCHINPAITVSMLIARKISARDAALYIVFQCVGAVIGAGILYAIATGTPLYNIAVNGLGQNGYGIASPAGYNLTAALIAEIVLTFIFVLVVHGSTHDRVPKGFRLSHRLGSDAGPHSRDTDNCDICESCEKFRSSRFRRRLGIGAVVAVLGGTHHRRHTCGTCVESLQITQATTNPFSF